MLTHLMIKELASRDLGGAPETMEALLRMPEHVKTALVQQCSSHAQLRTLCALFGVTADSAGVHTQRLTNSLWYDAWAPRMPAETRWSCAEDPVTCAAIWDERVVMGTAGGDLCFLSRGSGRVISRPAARRGRRGAVLALTVRDATSDGHPSLLYAMDANAELTIWRWSPREELLVYCSGSSSWSIADRTKSRKPVIVLSGELVNIAWEVGGNMEFIPAPHPFWNVSPAPLLPIFNQRAWRRGRALARALTMGQHYITRHLCGADGWIARWTAPRDPPEGWDGTSALMINHMNLPNIIEPAIVNLTNFVDCTVTCLAILSPDTLLVGFHNGGILQYALAMDPSAPSGIAVKLERNMDTGLGNVCSIHCHPRGSRYAVVSYTDMIRVYDRVGAVRTLDMQRHRGRDRRYKANKPKAVSGARIVCLDDERLFVCERDRGVCHVWDFGPNAPVAVAPSPEKKKRRKKGE